MAAQVVCPPPSDDEILRFLSERYSPRNKVPGVVAEVEFARYIESLGMGERLVRGGWIVEPNAPDFFSKRIAIFPASFGGSPAPSTPVITAAQYLRSAGMRSLWAVPLPRAGMEFDWLASDITGPNIGPLSPIQEAFSGYPLRQNRLTHRHYNTDISPLRSTPSTELQTLFARESMLDSIRGRYLTVANDLDYLIWGQHATYPVEIKEKTRANDPYMGDYFGIDVGPFAKLSTFTSFGSELKGLFVVREIDNVTSRSLRAWHIVRSDQMCQKCSWVFRSGGMSMRGTASATVRVPIAAFEPLSLVTLQSL